MNETWDNGEYLYQCGGADDWMLNNTDLYTLKSGYICGYQQAMWDGKTSAGAQMSIPVYLAFAAVTMFVMVNCDI